MRRVFAETVSFFIVEATNERSRVYYMDDEILIRNMQESDAQVITGEEILQGWVAEVGKYLMRLKDQREGRAVSLVAEYNGKVAGYINIYPDSKWGAFEIKDGNGVWYGEAICEPYAECCNDDDLVMYMSKKLG